MAARNRLDPRLQNHLRAWFWRRRHAGETLPTYAWAPFDIAGTQLYLDARVLDHVWQEHNDSSTPALNRVSAATQSVGSIASPANAHVFRASAATNRPTYRTGPARFEFDGTNDRMVGHNTATGAFDFLHTTGVGTILMKIGIRNNGTLYAILNSNNASSANRGINIQRTASNTVQITVSSGGVSVFNFTTTATLTAAMGVVPVEIRFNNASGGDVRINSGLLETFTRSNVPAAGNAFADLNIGARSGGTTFAQLDMTDLLITDTYVSDADIALWRAYAPTVTTYKRQIAISTTGTPCFNFTHRWHCFGASHGSTLWQDTARTVAVAANNDPVRVVDNRLMPTGILNRRATASADANRPLWSSSGGGITFDGSNDSLVLDSSDAMGGGARTWILVYRHNPANPTTQSRPIDAGVGYVTVSGLTNAINANHNGVPYTAQHTVGGSGSAVTDIPNQSGYNIIAFTREGATWNGRASGNNTTNAAYDLLSNSEGSTWTAIGDAGGTNNADGNLVEVVTYMVALSTDEIDIEFRRLARTHTGLGLGHG